jgi:uncharacterized membrane protein
MPQLWEAVLNAFNFVGDHSGCHQLPERCFTVKGYTFPLCARCTGVFLGQSMALLLLPFGVRSGWIPALVLLGLMGFDWTLQRLEILPSTNPRRLVTGILGGFGLFSLYIQIAVAGLELIHPGF